MSLPANVPWWAGLLGLLLAVVAHGTPTAAAAASWQVVSNKNGLLVERRASDGALYEVRVTAESSLAPAAIFETIWAQREHPQFVPHLKRLDLLSDSGDERLAYEQVEVPLARDRDYTVRVRRSVDADAHRYEIAFATADEEISPFAKTKGH